MNILIFFLILISSVLIVVKVNWLAKQTTCLFSLLCIEYWFKICVAKNWLRIVAHFEYGFFIVIFFNCRLSLLFLFIHVIAYVCLLFINSNLLCWLNNLLFFNCFLNSLLNLNSIFFMLILLLIILLFILCILFFFRQLFLFFVWFLSCFTRLFFLEQIMLLFFNFLSLNMNKFVSISNDIFSTDFLAWFFYCW